MRQENKINPATGYVHDDSQLEDKPQVVAEPEIAEPEQPSEQDDHHEASE